MTATKKGTEQESVPDDKTRVTCQLSLSAADKRKLKITAARKNITVSALVTSWIKEFCDD